MEVMKKQKTFFVLVAILIGIGIGILLWNFLGPVLAKGVFYYQVAENKANLFLVKNSKSKQILSISAREAALGDYRPPRHSYISHERKSMIYFNQVNKVPVESPSEEITVSRIIYEPMLINLKNSQEKKIDQLIDSASLVFSPNDNQIVWIKQIEESTFEQIEKSNKKRELWISKIDGSEAKLLFSFDEHVILLAAWSGDYVYFQGLWDINNRTLGRVNIKTQKVDYMLPRNCDKNLVTCKNIEFSPSGRKFLYEVYNKKDDRDVTELYLGDFENKESLQILTTDQISDRLWIEDGEKFFYTEQETVKKEGGGSELKETVHLVDIKNQTDDKLYSGSYVSQLTFDGNRYLYFLEKGSEGNRFNLVRLDIRKKNPKTILTEDYNKVLLIR